MKTLLILTLFALAGLLLCSGKAIAQPADQDRLVSRTPTNGVLILTFKRTSNIGKPPIVYREIWGLDKNGHMTLKAREKADVTPEVIVRTPEVIEFKGEPFVETNKVKGVKSVPK